MLRTSLPCAVTTSGAPPARAAMKPGRDEEVRVDDVGRARRARLAGEGQIAELPARACVENGQLDLVAPRHELALDLRDERPEVGRVGPGVHLGDEQDAHGASVRGPRTRFMSQRRRERPPRRSRSGPRRAGRAAGSLPAVPRGAGGERRGAPRRARRRAPSYGVAHAGRDLAARPELPGRVQPLAVVADGEQLAAVAQLLHLARVDAQPAREPGGGKRGGRERRATCVLLRRFGDESTIAHGRLISAWGAS